MHTPQAVVTMPHHQGVGSWDPTSLAGWLVCGRWVFGGESGTARRQGADRTPRGAPHQPRRTPHPQQVPNNRGWRRSGLREAPAGLRSTLRRTPPTSTDPPGPHPPQPDPPGPAHLNPNPSHKPRPRTRTPRRAPTSPTTAPTGSRPRPQPTDSARPLPSVGRGPRPPDSARISSTDCARRMPSHRTLPSAGSTSYPRTSGRGRAL